MAKKKRKSRSRRSRRKSPGFGQKLLVGVSGMVLVLCVASITYGFFFRFVEDEQPTRQFRIDVLNGTGKKGLANDAMKGLLRRGIDVIEVGNAPTFDYEESVLLARRPGADVETLGELLGCSHIAEQIKKDSMADATLILGADYRKLNLDWEHTTGLME